MKKIAASIPRKMFWSDNVPNKLRCPFCKSKLESEHHMYLMAVTSSIGDDTFYIGNEFGRFCVNCPIVVLDRQGFDREMEQISQIEDYRDVQTIFYTVFGIIDLEAVPPEKEHIPLGDDDNPIPLVKFIESFEWKKDLENSGGKRRLSGNERRRRQKYKG